MAARDIALARLTGCRLHLLHISTAGTVELVRAAKAEGARVTAEATPHHFTLTDAALETLRPETQGQSTAAHRRGCGCDHPGAGGRNDRCDRDRSRSTRGRGEGPGVRLRAAGDDRARDRAGSDDHRARRARSPRSDDADRIAVDRARADPRARHAGVPRDRFRGEPGRCSTRPRRWSVDATSLQSKSRNTPFARPGASPGRVMHTFFEGRPTVRDGKVLERGSCVSDDQEAYEPALARPRGRDRLRGYRLRRGRDHDRRGLLQHGTLTGYQEVLTDPSYHGQIVTMTAPQIGNTGVERARRPVAAAVGRGVRRARGIADGLVVALRGIARRLPQAPRHLRDLGGRHPPADPAPPRPGSDAGALSTDIVGPRRAGRSWRGPRAA